jgi:hypothetical protein
MCKYIWVIIILGIIAFLITNVTMIGWKSDDSKIQIIILAILSFVAVPALCCCIYYRERDARQNATILPLPTGIVPPMPQSVRHSDGTHGGDLDSIRSFHNSKWVVSHKSHKRSSGSKSSKNNNDLWSPRSSKARTPKSKTRRDESRRSFDSKMAEPPPDLRVDITAPPVQITASTMSTASATSAASTVSATPRPKLYPHHARHHSMPNMFPRLPPIARTVLHEVEADVEADATASASANTATTATTAESPV